MFKTKKGKGMRKFKEDTEKKKKINLENKARNKPKAEKSP